MQVNKITIVVLLSYQTAILKINYLVAFVVLSGGVKEKTKTSELSAGYDFRVIITTVKPHAFDTFFLWFFILTRYLISCMQTSCSFAVLS